MSVKLRTEAEMTMKCNAPNCDGEIESHLCNKCGAAQNEEIQEHQSDSVAKSVLAMLDRSDRELTEDKMFEAARALQTVVADDYQTWRAQADLLVACLKKLETRDIQPDESIKVIGVPLLEKPLRDAAEAALRNCAHFAESLGENIRLVDEANRVRRTTWV